MTDQHTQFLQTGRPKDAMDNFIGLHHRTKGPTMTPSEILLTAESTINQRGQERDTGQERSMAATVAAFNAIEGTSLTERQGWAFMQTLKMVRAASTARNGRFNPDDYVDGAAYAALGGECAASK